MTVAQVLNQIVADMIPLLDQLAAKTDPKSQADYVSLSGAINTLTTDAMQANALDVETKLANSADARARLTAFTAQANAQATALAQHQANVAKFVSLATHVGQLLTAAAGGNLLGGASAALDMLGDLGITAPAG